VQPKGNTLPAEHAELATDAVRFRRSARISKEVLVILSGSDAAGRQFAERTRTLVLSRHGASVISHYKLIPEQETFLRIVSTSREVEVRICGQIGERQDGYIYGVAFLDTSIDFWGVEFPAAQAPAKDLQRVTLECSACHTQANVQFDATEMDVYAVNQGLLRYCRKCAVSTIWKTAVERPVPAQQVPAPPMPAVTSAQRVEPDVFTTREELISAPVELASFLPPPPAKKSNRRRDRRTRVKFQACIRFPGTPEDVVSCEDMSRGGFSFRSSRLYGIEAMVEVAVPYTDGPMSIFVPAQIVNFLELEKGKLYRYGAAYVRKKSPYRGEYQV